MNISDLLEKISTLDNCIKSQEEDFPGISNGEAEQLGKLLYKSLISDDDLEFETNFQKYMSKRKEQEQKACTQNTP